jgi:very-short-patch-repair endonuclease
VRGVDKARELRRRQTGAEALLWWPLRDRRLGGFKFRRQRAIGRFIVDFVCPERMLVVELDGGQHLEQAGYDDARTHWLHARGYLVRRYWNDDVLANPDSVLEDILMHVSAPVATAPHPSPLPACGEREFQSGDACRCAAPGWRGPRR